MKHAYLTKQSIDKAYLQGGITVREANELLSKLENCTKLLNRNSKRTV